MTCVQHVSCSVKAADLACRPARLSVAAATLPTSQLSPRSNSSGSQLPHFAFERTPDETQIILHCCDSDSRGLAMHRTGLPSGVTPVDGDCNNGREVFGAQFITPSIRGIFTGPNPVTNFIQGASSNPNLLERQRRFRLDRRNR